MLANYTKAAQDMKFDQHPHEWAQECTFFNQRLLAVEIPKSMVGSYAQKIDMVKTGNTARIKFSEESIQKVHNPTKVKLKKGPRSLSRNKKDNTRLSERLTTQLTTTSNEG